MTLITRLFRALTTREFTDAESTGITHLARKVIATNVIKETEDNNKHKYDFDITSVEEELGQVISKLLQINHKIVFVIDELDKIDVPNVMNIIKSLKTLFRTLNALFIIITGEEFFIDMTKWMENRSARSSLFSQRALSYKTTI
jgi:hypothetical protein